MGTKKKNTGEQSKKKDLALSGTDALQRFDRGGLAASVESNLSTQREERV